MMHDGRRLEACKPWSVGPCLVRFAGVFSRSVRFAGVFSRLADLGSRRATAPVVAAGLMAVALVATPATAATDVCIASHGVVEVQQGHATCEASGEASRAEAEGVGSSARATGGDDNNAVAHGESSTAFAFNGSNNVAIATGASTGATAGNGDHNTATANAPSSNADAGGGDSNTATANTDGCLAHATGGGATQSC